MNTFLVLRLDDDVVLLHPDGQRLIILDQWAQTVWHHCVGHTTQEVIQLLDASASRIQDTLQTLTTIGTIWAEENRWVHAQMTWV